MEVQLPLTTRSKPLVGGWYVVGMLFFVGCLNYLDRIMIATMRESIVTAIPMTEAEFGLLTSVFLWVYGLLSPFAGFLADRFSRSRVIIVSLFIWSAVTWMTAHSTTFSFLLVTRALMGVSEACFLPAALAMIADYHRGSTRSLATGIFLGGVMVGQSLGFLGGWIAEKHDWSAAFNIFGLVGIALSIVLVFFLKDPPEGASREKARPEPRKTQAPRVNFFEAVKILFASRSFIILLAFWGMLGMIGWMIMAWLPTYYSEHFHLSQATAGLYATGYLYPVCLAGLVIGGVVADRLTRRNRRARILVPAFGLLVAAPAIYLASSTSAVYIAIICFIFYAFARIFSDGNLMPMLCMIADKRYRATGYGILNMFACIVGGLGIFASGALRDAHINLSLMFKVAALSMVVCSGLLFMIKIKYDDTQES